MSMTSEELEGFPYGTSNLPPEAVHDLMIEDYLGRQLRYAREDAIGTIFMTAKENVKRLATSADFEFLGRVLAAVVKGVCVHLGVPVSRIRHDGVQSFDRSLQWGERSDVINGRDPVEEP